MFDWISRIVEAISNSIGSMVSFLGTEIANAVFDAILKWFYEIIYNAVADFFTEMGKMGAEMFDLSWVQATVTLFLCLLADWNRPDRIIQILYCAAKHICTRSHRIDGKRQNS